VDLTELRQEYTRAGLTREMLADNPLAQFELWIGQAQNAELLEPNAMTLATVDSSGQPFTQ